MKENDPYCTFLKLHLVKVYGKVGSEKVARGRREFPTSVPLAVAVFQSKVFA